MSGRRAQSPRSAAIASRFREDEPSFTRVRLDFADDGSLAYTNKRMLGRVNMVEDAVEVIAAEGLGPHALDPALDSAAFRIGRRGCKRRRQVRPHGSADHRCWENLFGRNPVSGTRGSNRMHQRASSGTAQTPVPRSPQGPRNSNRTEKFVERMLRPSLAKLGPRLPERKKDGHCLHCRSPLKIFKVGGRTAYCCPHCQW